MGEQISASSAASIPPLSAYALPACLTSASLGTVTIAAYVAVNIGLSGTVMIV